MASGIGHLDSIGNACLKLHLCGVAHSLPGVELEAIIDTGFTGFIHLPLQHAISLRLPLFGTTSATLADGSTSVCLTALCQTTFGGTHLVGVAMLAPAAQDILVGMDFLRKFKLGLLIASGVVALPDEAIVTAAMAASAPPPPQANTAAPPPQANTATPPTPPPVEPSQEN